MYKWKISNPPQQHLTIIKIRIIRKTITIIATKITIIKIRIKRVEYYQTPPQTITQEISQINYNHLSHKTRHNKSNSTKSSSTTSKSILATITTIKMTSHYSNHLIRTLKYPKLVDKTQRKIKSPKWSVVKISLRLLII